MIIKINHRIPFTAEHINRHDVTCNPRVVWFNMPSTLNVDLKILHFPEDNQLDYKVIVYSKKGNRHTQLAIVGSGAKYKPNEPVHIEHNVYYDWDKANIGYCIYNQEKTNCDLDNDRVYDVIYLQYSDDPKTSDCIGDSKCELTLDLENDCKVQNTPPSPRRAIGHSDVPTLSLKDIGTGQLEHKVIVTCSVVAQKFDLLSLYQTKSTGNPVLLKIVQHLEDEKDKMELTMKKDFVNSDVGFKMYCVKQRPDDHTYYKESNGRMLGRGDFKYLKDADDARVIVEPATTFARFSRDEPLSLVCSGTTPVDGRSLTWYIRDKNTSEIEVADISSQHYDREANENRLMLLLNESYESKTLFCAQDRHLVVQHVGGRRSVTRYAEVAASRTIELKHEKQKGPDLGLVCGLPAGLVALLVVAAVAGRRLRRGRAGAAAGGGPEENIYASPEELTYAVLNLPESGALVKKTNASPYAQIVGVYNPRK